MKSKNISAKDLSANYEVENIAETTQTVDDIETYAVTEDGIDIGGDIGYLSDAISSLNKKVNSLTTFPPPKMYPYSTITDYKYRRLSSGAIVQSAYEDGSKFIIDAYPDPHDDTEYTRIFAGKLQVPTPQQRNWVGGLLYHPSQSGTTFNGLLLETSSTSIVGTPLTIEDPLSANHATTVGWVNAAIANIKGPDISVEYEYTGDQTNAEYEHTRTDTTNGVLGIFFDMTAIDTVSSDYKRSAMFVRSITVNNGNNAGSTPHNDRDVYGALYEVTGHSLNTAKFLVANNNGAQKNNQTSIPMEFVFGTNGEGIKIFTNKTYLLLFNEQPITKDTPISSCQTLGSSNNKGLRCQVVPGPTNSSALEHESNMATLSGGSTAFGTVNTNWIPNATFEIFDVRGANFYIDGEKLKLQGDYVPLSDTTTLSGSLSNYLSMTTVEWRAPVLSTGLSNGVLGQYPVDGGMCVLSAPIRLANELTSEDALLTMTSNQKDAGRWTTKYSWGCVKLLNGPSYDEHWYTDELSFFWQRFKPNSTDKIRRDNCIARFFEVSDIVSTYCDQVSGNMARDISTDIINVVVDKLSAKIDELIAAITKPSADIDWTTAENSHPEYEMVIDGVSEIGPSAYYGRRSNYYASKLKSLYIGNSVTSIGDWAFYGCSSLTSLTMGNSVTSIGDWAFYGCSSLTSLTIPDTVTSIGDRAFYNCNSLTSLTIPDSVTSIGDYAFYNCSSLTSLTMGNSVTSIGVFAFSRCYSLNSLTIPNSVTSIGGNSFSYCSSLTSLTIPDSVTSIGGMAFYYCSSLTSLTIPDSVTSIGANAFYYCRSSCAITFDKPKAQVSAMGNYPWSIRSGAVISCTDGNLTVR